MVGALQHIRNTRHNLCRRRLISCPWRGVGNAVRRALDSAERSARCGRAARSCPRSRGCRLGGDGYGRRSGAGEPRELRRHDHRRHDARPRPHRLPEQRDRDRRRRHHPRSERPHDRRRRQAVQGMPRTRDLRRRGAQRRTRWRHGAKRRGAGNSTAASSSAGHARTACWTSPRLKNTSFGFVVFSSAQILVRGSSGSRNIAPEGDGMGLFGSHDVRIVDNEFRRNPGPGIHVQASIRHT